MVISRSKQSSRNKYIEAVYLLIYLDHLIIYRGNKLTKAFYPLNGIHRYNDFEITSIYICLLIFNCLADNVLFLCMADLENSFNLIYERQYFIHWQLHHFCTILTFKILSYAKLMQLFIGKVPYILSFIK